MRHTFSSSSHQLANVHRPLRMAQFIWSAIIFLPLLGYLSRAQDLRTSLGVRALRKESGYGRPVLAMANSPRCTFNGKPIEDGKSVSSPEPCLNCTCSKGILLCYLHTCNSIAPTPGCQIVKKPNTCCPQLECSDLLTYHDYRTERTSEPSNKFRFRQDDNHFFGLLEMDSRTDRSQESTFPTRRAGVKGQRPNFSSILKGISSQKRSDTYGQSLYEQEEDIEDDELSPDRNNSAGYCFSRGYKYSEGMAMLSPTKCEYCYCIGGQQMCVRPKCHLNIEGCVPRYQSGYTCCPSHYNCEVASGVSTLGGEENSQTESDSETTAKTKVTSCNVEGYDFDVGVAVPSNGHCQTCYCTQAGVVCRRLECSPSIPGCTPVIPEGHCCPTQYKCDQKNVNSSHIPVPHSTDNYDVTVISPIESEGTSSQSSRTEEPDLYTETAEDSPTTYVEDAETASETSSEKQKITVELPSESDLESISVIPEENIAVLILTTEKEDDEGKVTSAEITSHTSTREEITTKLVPATILNAKRKSKPTKTSTVNDKIQNFTRFTTLGANTNPSTITTSREGTTQQETDSTIDEKDTYAYDYEEMYEDGSPDLTETFSPFLDYSTTAFEETGVAASSQERSPIAIKHHKIKQKRPQSTTFHHISTTKVDLPTTNELFTYNKKGTDFTQDESTYSTFSRSDIDETITNEPSEYTIYSSSRTKNPDTTTNIGTRITRPYTLQKIKKRRPGIVTKHKTSPFSTQNTRPIQVVTGPGMTVEDIFNTQTVPLDTTTERKTFVPFAAETNTQIYRPYTRPPHFHKKKVSNRRGQPETLSETTILHKTTKPSPQGIAEFLRTITQTQNTQTPNSSIEEVDSTTKKVSGDSVSRETLPPIVLAAPKLIMEAPTLVNTQETTKTDPIVEETIPSSPSFNIQPEIIFSNHSPFQNRKQPPRFTRPTREPEIPLIINNHKRTSTRLRPAVAYRPVPTPPSEENSFVEISNHRPTNSFRRPASQFPPFPVPNRPDGNYQRDTHPRDSQSKLHRIDSDVPGEWADDYEEYYYNTDHDHSTLTKIFNNIQSYQPTLANGEFSAKLKATSTSATVNDLSAETITPAYNVELAAEVESKASDLQNVASESSENTDGDKNSNNKYTTDHKISENREDEATTKAEMITEIPTTPMPKTTYYVPTITTTTPEDTTKSFSGYVRNKYKGTSIHLHDSEPKFFRVDDDAESKRRESDYRLIEYGKKPEETFISYTERLTQNRPTLTTEAPVQPTKEQDEPQEITDVCFVDGRYYNSGETITKSNPCEMCRCFYGHPLCQVQQCPPPPDPSCALDYLPGYCCPRVTCGLETDPDQPPGIVSLPEPTSQEIRRSDTDNQWKPLPHGPLLRTTESTFKAESTTIADVQPIHAFVTPKLQTEKAPEVNNMYVWAGDSKIQTTEPSTEKPETTTVITTTEQQTTTEEATTSSTTEQPTTTVVYRETIPTTETPLATESTESTEEIRTLPPSTTTITIPTTEVNEVVDATSEPKPLAPIFDPKAEENKGQQNKSGIHDNSSGVRKILHDLITLPPSKVELSISDTSNISTVLPVIITFPTTVPSVEEFGTVTMNSADIGVVTELGGNLKVSGCNVYGKYYKINDKVTALSKPCTECVCSAEGIACNPTC
ncbi:mucin-2-like isoform X2 [Argiope bruennichi]|uniref:mucin-2-like isoform X2 n=1 Tax=Argiope bruennichi TaxID=94029 RepID=UPI002495A1B8|nr:mucin-2-like isoform X2 [Argiope bruennichi]